jgi:hypothetical protein
MKMPMKYEDDEMPMWQVMTLVAGFVVAVDFIAFIYATNTGWRYPFALCAIVNMGLVVATHVLFIARMLFR